MDLKSAFLNDLISEKVSVKQSLGFEDLKHYKYAFQLKKLLYGLKKALRAWYDKLSNFLLENGLTCGQVTKTLFRKTLKNDILVFQIYVDNIIFLFY